MPIFKYRVKKGSEGTTEGKIEVPSEKEAIERLSQMGLIPLKIEEEVGPIEARSQPRKATGKIKSRDITIFSRELASLFKSGVPILNAISIISEQSESPNFRAILQDIHDAVKDGATFSSALARYPKVFSSIYVAMVRTGENSGALSEVLLSIADYRTKQEETTSRIRMALAYPILMAFVGLATVIFMFIFVIPRLTRIYVTMGQNLPLPTRMLLAISDGIRKGWPGIILILAIIIFMVRQQSRTAWGKKFWSLFILRLPIMGKMILKAELSRFCRTLGLLIKNGIAILSAIDIAAPVLDNEFLRDQVSKSHKDLEQGSSFGKSLKGSKAIPLFMSNLISVGEESGRLHGVLDEVARSYEQDTDEAIRIMSSLLEPIMILVMGLIVGFIVVAMLLPIFDINAMVK